MDRPPPAPLPAAVRWLLIVLLPAVGFLAGAVGAFALTRAASATAMVLVALAGGAAGAAALLALGLALAPWLPAADMVAPGDLEDGVPPASHPDDVSWIGPSAALLMGLVLGVFLGAEVGRYGVLAEGTVVVAGAVSLLLLCLHPPRGAAAVPSATAPFHRLVARALLCAALGGALVAPSGAVAIDLAEGHRWPPASEVLLMSVAPGALLAALVSLTETLAWRVPPRWRWPWLLLAGATATPSIALATVFLLGLRHGHDPLVAGFRALSEVAAMSLERPGWGLGATASLGLPVALLAAARAGVLPYFGQRAPWPTSAQVPLAWFAAAAGVALLSLSRGHRWIDLHIFVPYLAATAPALVVALRLAAPLEEGLARRWVLLTGGGR
ncbi:MAG: hypothetical protein KF878_15655 [Planctomycetes bacterium]|nr:hypothetical protein [Planctomycetota bacterium]